MPLSDTWLRANHNKISAQAFEKTDRDSLSVRVSAKGKIVFQMRFYLAGKPCRLDIGTYPGVSLKQAREYLIKYKTDLAQGHDPRLVKKFSQQENAQAVTVQAVFEAWYKSYCVENKLCHVNIKRTFELHVFPTLGSLPADKVSTNAWCNLIEERVKKSAAIGERILINAKQCLSWAVRRKLVADNPLALITSKADFNIVKRAETRILNNAELKLLWIALEHSNMSLKNRLFIKLCLFFGCRNGELRNALKSDFDLVNNVWTIPPHGHKAGKKSGKALLRPIIDEIKPDLLELFELSHGEYLVTNLYDDNQPLKQSASGALPYRINQYIKNNKLGVLDDWSLHDLRRTARTHWSEFTPPHIAEVMMGHVLNITSQQSVYDRYSYLSEQKKAYEDWYKRLKAIVL